MPDKPKFYLSGDVIQQEKTDLLTRNPRSFRSTVQLIWAIVFLVPVLLVVFGVGVYGWSDKWLGENQQERSKRQTGSGNETKKGSSNEEEKDGIPQSALSSPFSDDAIPVPPPQLAVDREPEIQPESIDLGKRKPKLRYSAKSKSSLSYKIKRQKGSIKKLTRKLLDSKKEIIKLKSNVKRLNLRYRETCQYVQRLLADARISRVRRSHGRQAIILRRDIERAESSKMDIKNNMISTREEIEMKALQVKGLTEEIKRAEKQLKVQEKMMQASRSESE